MTENVLDFWSQILSVVAGAVVLLVFALVVALPHRPKVLPGSQGHRDESEQPGHEVIRADGFIDGFAKLIAEAGGSMPWIIRLALPGILLWWLLYLIYNWTPR